MTIGSAKSKKIMQILTDSKLPRIKKDFWQADEFFIHAFTVGTEMYGLYTFKPGGLRPTSFSTESTWYPHTEIQ